MSHPKNNHATSHPWCFEMDQVLQSSQFFWIGRGGFGVTHPGNAFVRQEVSKKILEFIDTPKDQRINVAKRLLQNELKHVRFVISRDVILSRLEHDNLLMEQQQQQPKHSAARKKTPKRKLGMDRRESILALHRSVEQIATYKEGTSIEVGQKWCLNILSRLLRAEKRAYCEITKDLASEDEDKEETEDEDEEEGEQEEDTSCAGGGKRKRQDSSPLPSSLVGGVLSPPLPTLERVFDNFPLLSNNERERFLDEEAKNDNMPEHHPDIEHHDGTKKPKISPTLDEVANTSYANTGNSNSGGAMGIEPIFSSGDWLDSLLSKELWEDEYGDWAPTLKNTSSTR